MEEVASKLENMFKETEANLEAVEEKVQQEMHQLSSSYPAAVNPAEVLENLKQVKKDYASVVEETKVIQEAQKEAMQFFRDNLLTLTQAVTKLQTSDFTAEDRQQIQELTALLGAAPSCDSTPSDTVTSQASSAANSTENSQCETRKKQPIPRPLPTPKLLKFTDKQSADENEYGEPLSPRSTRANSWEFIAVKDEEFKTVADHIKGRVKLEDVNRVYQCLWRHFKEEGNKVALNQEQLYQMGLRVAGRTGEAKLKVLQTLGLITMTKSREVKIM